jgi:monofunctional biosynthetic peptidoglycan transglycosylase
MLRGLKRLLLTLVGLWVVLHLMIAGVLLVWKFVPVTNSMFMISHRITGSTPVTQEWLAGDKLSDNLKRATLASEDSGFTAHHGFDLESMKKAYASNESGKKVRGGSTITQQLAKNLFLTGHRSYIRKGEEALITLMIEGLWSKQRILTVYLNVVEYGDGIYGAEAAAQHYYGKSAKSLTKDQAAFLASILPNPKYYQDHRGNGRLNGKIRTIKKRMNQVALPSG